MVVWDFGGVMSLKLKSIAFVLYPSIDFFIKPKVIDLHFVWIEVMEGEGKGREE